MESIGEKLKAKREELGFSIDQVARDTNIAKAYLTALEDEHFEEFPGETYLIGFLRNYSEYLGLNAEEVISLYKSFKIQEQPIPMDELIVKPRIPVWLTAAFVIIGVAGIGIGGFFLLPDLTGNNASVETAQSAEPVPEPEPAPEPQEKVPANLLQMDEDILEQRFDQGTVIRFTKGDRVFDIKLSRIANDITLDSSGNSFVLALGQEEMLDLDGSGDPDIYVLIRDIDGESGVIRFDRQVVHAAAEAAAEAPESTPAEEPAVAEPDIGATNVATREKKPSVILREQNDAPFAVKIQFRGYCLIRYEVDDKDRIERYFKKDELLRLDALKQVRIWLSNGGNVAAQVGGNDVVFGRPGEVAAGLIHWVPKDGVYELTLQPVY